jgi:hypothetical protein
MTKAQRLLLVDIRNNGGSIRIYGAEGSVADACLRNGWIAVCGIYYTITESGRTLVAPKAITVHGVLAGAYRGKRASLKATLTHASTDDGATAICERVEPGNLCDLVIDAEPTCPECLSYKKLIETVD